MSIRKMKNDIKELKQGIGLSEEPTLQNFFKFCKKYYGRQVHCGELIFTTYKTGPAKRMINVESHPLLFLRLSEEYFTKLHNVRNPVKDGIHGLKGLLISYWHEEIYTGDNKYLNFVFEDEDFNAWFNEYWDNLKKEFNKIDLEEIKAKQPIGVIK